MSKIVQSGRLTSNIFVTHMPLTNTAIQALKPADKPYSKPDGFGLILYVRVYRLGNALGPSP